MGGNVVLDYGCWARVERDDYRNRAKKLGADFKLHYMDVRYSELYRRLEDGNRNLAEDVFEISKAEMDRYNHYFPTADRRRACIKSFTYYANDTMPRISSGT
jgi:hypothetical protein